MATLAGNTIATTYATLIKLDANNATLVAGGSAAIQLKTGDNDTTPIYLNTDRVGIGTSVPGQILTVAATDAAATMSLIKYDSSTTITAAEVLGTFYFGGTDPSSSYQVGAAISGLADDAWASADCPARLNFLTCANGDNELITRMSITENGTVGIGTGSPAHRLNVDGGELISVGGEAANASSMNSAMATNNSTGLALYSEGSGSDVAVGRTTITFGRFTYAGASMSDNGCLDFDIQGKVIARMLVQTSYDDDSQFLFYTADSETRVLALTIAKDQVVSGNLNDTSDVMFKKDISDVSNGLSVINQLKPRDFTWKKDDRKCTGFIAQELEEILPDLVNGENADSLDVTGKSIHTGGIVAILTKAVQELSAKVEALENA